MDVLKKQIWRLRFAWEVHRLGLVPFSMAWGISSDAFRDFGIDGPVEAAMCEMSYWGEAQ